MEKMSTINIRVNAKDKEQATNILKDLGLNMSTAINIFIKQIIKRDGLPFEISNPEPTEELLEALEEGKKIEEEIKAGKRTGYRNVKELIEALENDD
jgi:DNA-damage-inducible protein J